MKTENFEIQTLKEDLVLTPPSLKKPTLPLDFKKVNASVVSMIERLKTKRDALFEKKWL